MRQGRRFLQVRAAYLAYRSIPRIGAGYRGAGWRQLDERIEGLSGEVE